MKKGFFFAIVFIFQISIPLLMIAERELTLRTGEVLKIKVRPVDPFDAFRGNFLIVNINNEVPSNETFETGDTVYVTFEKDDEGFFDFNAIHKSEPENATFLKTTILRKNWLSGFEGYAVEIPFDRYYLNEKLAPTAERAMFNAGSQRTHKTAHIEIRVRNGNAAIAGLYIDEISVEDYVMRILSDEKESSKKYSDNEELEESLETN